jgi:NhaA family Na+:H+ antiporter
MKNTRLYKEFFESEKAGGLILVFCTVISLILANSLFKADYTHLWHITIANHALEYWINDGLMTIFFLLIGLELKREIYRGELSSVKNVTLPLFAALGGMLVPAGIYLFFNKGLPTQTGIGIPMATDIAFAIGILSLLGNKVPTSLKIFLTALAVMDDLGAIFVIAIFYTSTIVYINLCIALGILGVLFILNRLKVYSLIPYIIGGILMWYFMLQTGIHATITGVLVAFVIPFGDTSTHFDKLSGVSSATGEKKSTSYKLQHFLHKPVAFIILPLFALANTCITFNPQWIPNLWQPNSIGVFMGLVIGKPLGICLFSFSAVFVGICALPSDLKWKHIIGASFLGGIGFTMSIFITLLAFNDDGLITGTKITILLSSLIAGFIGFIWLKSTLKTEINSI